LTAEERKGLAKRNTENPEAHRLYVQGRYYLYKKTTEDWKKSLECFREAIRLDPNYASAYAGLADTYQRLGEGIIDPSETRPKARAAALKAVQIDDSLPEAHFALASSLLLEWDWSSAEKELNRALALRPTNGEAYQPYIRYLLARGRADEAVAEGKRVLEFNPASLILNADYGNQLYLARRYQEAIAQLRKTIELEPNYAAAHTRLGLVYLQVGRHEEAIAELKKGQALDNSPQRWGRLAILGYAYGLAGKPREAREVLHTLEVLSKQSHVSTFGFTLVHIGLGEKEQALQWLEKSFAKHNPEMAFLKLNPALDSLRSDPRFADLVRRMGIPD
jgi:tetratricopeptide (TPR) repeat protein